MRNTLRLLPTPAFIVTERTTDTPTRRPALLDGGHRGRRDSNRRGIAAARRFELAANHTADFDRKRTCQLRFPRLRRRDIQDNDVNTGALHRIEAVKEHLAQFFGSAGAHLSVRMRYQVLASSGSKPKDEVD